LLERPFLPPPPPPPTHTHTPHISRLNHFTDVYFVFSFGVIAEFEIISRVHHKHLMPLVIMLKLVVTDVEYHVSTIYYCRLLIFLPLAIKFVLAEVFSSKLYNIALFGLLVIVLAGGTSSVIILPYHALIFFSFIHSMLQTLKMSYYDLGMKLGYVL
jgi:hypothetical protein